jgi:hypothetical protein
MNYGTGAQGGFANPNARLPGEPDEAYQERNPGAFAEHQKQVAASLKLNNDSVPQGPQDQPNELMSANMESYLVHIGEIQKKITEALAAQKDLKNQKQRQKALVDAHKKTVADLAAQLRSVTDNKAAIDIGDKILELVPPGLSASGNDTVVKARLTIAFHERAVSVDMAQPVIDHLLDMFSVGYLHPIIHNFLREKGLNIEDIPHRLMMYVAKVLNMLYSQGLLNMLERAYSTLANISDDEYIEIVGGINDLVRYTCVSIYTNDTFSRKISDLINTLDLTDLLTALKKMASVASAAVVIDTMYPGLYPLFNLGCQTSSLVITYVMLAPGVVVVLGSSILCDWDATCEKIVAAKNAISACIPQHLLHVEPPNVAAAAPVDALPARDCQVPADRISALLDSAEPRVHRLFAIGSLPGHAERLVRHIVRTSADLITSAASILRTNPVNFVAKKAATAFSKFVNGVATLLRDEQCARKQKAEGTYEDNVCLLKMLLDDTDKFPAHMRSNIKLLIHILSYKTRYLSQSMIDYLIALDVLTHGKDMLPFGSRVVGEYSQTVAGSPTHSFALRAAQTEALHWAASMPENPMGGDDREIQATFSLFEPAELPQYSENELKLWLRHLRKLQQTGEAPPGNEQPWVGSVEVSAQSSMRDPISRILNGLISQPPEVVRSVNSIQELIPLVEKFDKYVKDEQMRIKHLDDESLQSEVNSADAASHIAAAASARCARGGGGDGSVLGSDDSDHDDITVMPADAAAKRPAADDDDTGDDTPSGSSASSKKPRSSNRGGKSRRKSRKNSKKTTRRNKGRKSSNTAKKSQQQRARNSIRRRRSSRKGRK